MSEILKVDMSRKKDWKSCFKQVSTVVEEGGLVVYPTETFYGLGGNGLDGKCAKKIYKLKGRSPIKPLLLLISDVDDLCALTQEVTQEGWAFVEAFWPGALTLIFKASKMVPDVITSGTGKVGIRIPGCQFTRKMVEAVGFPMVGTSANMSGKAGAKEIGLIHRDFGDKVALYLDGGKLDPGEPSTVVDLTGMDPVVLREGKIRVEQLENVR